MKNYEQYKKEKQAIKRYKSKMEDEKQNNW